MQLPQDMGPDDFGLRARFICFFPVLWCSQGSTASNRSERVTATEALVIEQGS